MKQIDVKLSCLIDQDDDQYVLYVKTTNMFFM